MWVYKKKTVPIGYTILMFYEEIFILLLFTHAAFKSFDTFSARFFYFNRLTFHVHAAKTLLFTLYSHSWEKILVPH